MITISAFRWVPPFAQGNVRDLRVRWVLEETGLPYEVRLIDADDQRSPGYRREQPFGQVPVLQQDGLALFETGAILLHVAELTGQLLPADPADRKRAICWLFAALSSVEPFLMNLAEVDFFTEDEELRARRRPTVVEAAEQRLGQLQAALGARDHLVGSFSIADLLMSSVLRIVGHTDMLDGFPRLAAFKARCEARPAFGRALRAQCADFEGNEPRPAATP